MLGHPREGSARHFMLSLSAHKFHWPKRFGALYIKREFATTSPFSRRIFRMLEERKRTKAVRLSAHLSVGLGLKSSGNDKYGAVATIRCHEADNAITQAAVL